MNEAGFSRSREGMGDRVGEQIAGVLGLIIAFFEDLTSGGHELHTVAAGMGAGFELV